MRGTGYAIAEIIWWLLVAALIGFVVGWLLRRWFLDRQESERLAEMKAEEEKKRDALQGELDDFKRKVAALSTDLDQRTADFERMKTQVEERESKIAGFESQISGHRSVVTKLEAKVEDREATIASLRNDTARENSQVADLRREVDAANGTIGALRKDADGYKSTIEALRNDLDAERHKHARLEEDSAAEAARLAELETGASDTTGLEERIATLESELSQVRQDRDTAVEMLADLEAEPAERELEPAAAGEPAGAPAVELPDKEVAVARVAEIATRTRGEGPGVEDDLKKIHGVGPKLETLLKSMDITSFRQVASFTTDDIQYVTAALDAFPGRIERDGWISSAAQEHLDKYGEPV